MKRCISSFYPPDFGCTNFIPVNRFICAFAFTVCVCVCVCVCVFKNALAQVYAGGRRRTIVLNIINHMHLNRNAAFELRLDEQVGCTKFM